RRHHVKLNRTGVATGLLAGAIALAACSSSANGGSNDNPPANTGARTSASSTPSGQDCPSGTLNAEGSTAQTNAINQWIKDYQSACSGATVNYNPTGSGAGITAFTAGQVDFAGSDSALDPDKGEVAAAQQRCASTPL